MKRSGFVLVSMLILAMHGRSQESLTIDGAVATARAHNRNLKSAALELEAAQWGRKSSYSRFLPKIGIDASLTRIDEVTERRANGAIDFINSAGPALGIPPSVLSNIKPFAYGTEYNVGLTLVQPIYNGGAEIVGVSAAYAEEERSQFSLDDTGQDVITRTRIAYYNVLKAEALAKLARESAERSRRNLEMTRRRAEMGMRTTADVLRWEVQLASDEGTIVNAENGVASARIALNEVMGVELDRSYRLEMMQDLDSLLTAADEPQPGPPLAGPGGGSLPPAIDAQLLDNHPAMRMMNANLQLAEAGVDLAWVNFKPRVNVAFQYGWEKNGTLALDGYQPWALSLTFSYPLFNGFGDYTNLQQARAQHSRTETQVESFRRVLDMQATNAALGVKAAWKRIEISRKAEREAQDVLNSVTRRYDNGGASNVDLIDIQTAYRSARTNLISALYDYYVAQALFARATGTVHE